MKKFNSTAVCVPSKHYMVDLSSRVSQIREMVDVDTVVGTPITTPDGITIIPVSRVSYGFGSGGSDFPAKEKNGFGGGSGAGVRIDPIGFLIIKDNNVRMINIAPPAANTVDRVIDMAPDIVDKVTSMIGKKDVSRDAAE